MRWSRNSGVPAPRDGDSLDAVTRDNLHLEAYGVPQSERMGAGSRLSGNAQLPSPNVVDNFLLCLSGLLRCDLEGDAAGPHGRKWHEARALSVAD